MNSPVTRARRPIAATRMSAVAATRASSTVLEWQTVTVQCSRNNSTAIGLPTMLLRPSTTARRPTSGISLRLSNSMMPAGVQGTNPGKPVNNRPAFSGWNPSTSLRGSTASITRCSLIPSGSGNCTRIPWTAGSVFSWWTFCSSSACDVEAARRSTREFIPALRAAFSLLRT